MNKSVSDSFRKSQIFLLDLIFATIIILVIVGISLSYYTLVSTNSHIYFLNNEIINTVTKTEINSLNSEYIRDLFIQGKIENYHNTIIQQIVAFYLSSNYGDSRNLTEDFLQNHINKQYNINITLRNSTRDIELYSKLNRDIRIEDASIVSVRKREVMGFVNSTSSFGPFTLKIELWQ